MYVKSLCFWEGREKPVLSIFTISQQLYFCFYLGTSRLLRGRGRMILQERETVWTGERDRIWWSMPSCWALWWDWDRDRGGAFQYSRRGLRLRRRGAYGIHRASSPRRQGLCSLRSGGRRLAVRETIEYQIGTLPCTPFPAARDFAPVGSMSLDFQVASLSYKSSSFATSRGNERYEGKNSESYTSGSISAFSPFGALRHHLPPAVRWGGKRKAP